MFDLVKNIAQQAGLDPPALTQAVTDHLGTLNNNQLSDCLQTAASSLQNSGHGDLGTQVTGLMQMVGSNPSSVKNMLVSFIQSNPQVLAHFSPDFAQGIASRLGL